MTDESGRPDTADGALTDLTWRWAAFDELRLRDLYALLRLRQLAFIVEQVCPYADIDDLDRDALHLLGCAPDGRPVAYLRAFAPGARFEEGSIGRIVVTPGYRGRGLGRQVTRRGIELLHGRFPDAPIRLQAQAHLEAFYRSLGFETVSEPYDEDGIPHVDMVLDPAARGSAIG